jgi:hypothetical protein
VASKERQVTMNKHNTYQKVAGMEWVLISLPFSLVEPFLDWLYPFLKHLFYHEEKWHDDKTVSV